MTLENVVSSGSRSAPVATDRPVAVRVLFHATLPAWSYHTLPDGHVWTHGTTWLHGVDRARRRAWISHDKNQDGDMYELDTIDLASGTIDRWVATNPDARMRAFHPLTGRFEEDLAKYADMVEATGPFITRSRDYAGPHLAVSRDRIAYEADTDALMIASRDGSRPTPLISGVEAAYHPIFSPDGTRVAFDACRKRNPPAGAFYTCVYQVYVARVGVAPVAYPVLQPQPPTFSADGEHVFAAGRDDDHAGKLRDRGGCAYSMDVVSGATHALACTTTLHEVSFATGSKTGAFYGWRGTLGEQVVDFQLIDLASGQPRGTVSVDCGTDIVSFTDDWVVSSSQHGTVVIDLHTHRQAVLPDAADEVTVVSTQWKNDHVVYALRTSIAAPDYEILELDARAVFQLSRRTPP